MREAHFRFHGELNDFLPYRQRGTVITHKFDWRASIKDMIESLGPPHPEIELLVVNGKSVDFDVIVEPDVTVDAYDHLEAIPLLEKIALRPALDERPRFILDTHLGRLASYLRMMGFDTLYRNDYSDDELAYVSNLETRVLLTRDLGLLKRNLVVHGRFMRETNPKRQVTELLRRYPLLDAIEPFRHCMKCNGLLEWVDKADIAHRLPSSTTEHYDDFRKCPNCQQIYWKGSHYDRMQEFMAEVLNGG